jgi:hypothetical protein
MVDFSQYSWARFLVCKHSLWNHYSTVLMGKDIPYYLPSGMFTLAAKQMIIFDRCIAGYNFHYGCNHKHYRYLRAYDRRNQGNIAQIWNFCKLGGAHIYSGMVWGFFFFWSFAGMYD